MRSNSENACKCPDMLEIFGCDAFLPSQGEDSTAKVTHNMQGEAAVLLERSGLGSMTPWNLGRDQVLKLPAYGSL